MPSNAERPLPVLVVHWNRPAECLATLAHFQDQGIPVSIRIVDNASRPERLQALRKGLPPGVELVELAENRGWGGGLNVLLKEWLAEQGSDYCIVSAHDTVLHPECLTLLIAAMERDQTLGITCPQYETPEVAHFTPVGGIKCIVISPRPIGEVTPVEVPHGTLMVFRRQCIAAIGLFDERYFAYGDEAEIGLRARKMGWKVGLVWGATVINPGTWTSSPVVGYLSARGSLLTARMYGGLLKSLIRTALMFVNTLRMIFVPAAWNSMSSPRARFLAIRDFVFGRYGPPPRSLVPRGSRAMPEAPESQAESSPGKSDE